MWLFFPTEDGETARLDELIMEELNMSAYLMHFHILCCCIAFCPDSDLCDELNGNEGLNRKTSTGWAYRRTAE